MKKGFTMIELIFVVGTLAFVIAGLLVAYVNCLALNEHNLRFSNAISLARLLMEDMYYLRSDWSAIQDLSYSEQDVLTEFDVDGYSAAVYVNEIDPLLKEITVVVCWRERGGRIVGEDNSAVGTAVPLNGVLDTAEDINGDGRLSSPCELIAAIAKR
jgi:type II secretory pathway pseudopilin PulG